MCHPQISPSIVAPLTLEQLQTLCPFLRRPCDPLEAQFVSNDITNSLHSEAMPFHSVKIWDAHYKLHHRLGNFTLRKPYFPVAARDEVAKLAAESRMTSLRSHR